MARVVAVFQMVRSFLRILFSTFISWSVCAAAVMLPVMGMQWEIFTRPGKDVVEFVLDLMKDICGILAVLAGILAVLIVPLLQLPRGNPLLRRPGRAWIAGAAVFPVASVIWAFGLHALGTLDMADAEISDWFILAGASALGGGVFAFIHSYLTVLAARKAEGDPPVVMPPED